MSDDAPRGLFGLQPEPTREAILRIVEALTVPLKPKPRRKTATGETLH